MDYQDLLDPILRTAHRAGRAILAHYGRSIEVGRKADSSPVTAADREAEAIILSDLAEIAPGIAIIAEESVSAGRIPPTGDRFFLVDPLDGTREFIHHRDEFTVNIALIENEQPIFGVIYAPAICELYWTQARGAAFAGELDGASEVPAIKNERAIAARPLPADGPIAIASRSHLNEETKAFLANLGTAETLHAGSSLKFCRLAAGMADIYPRLGPTMEWDIAAGHAILTAAGGAVLQPDRTELTYGKREKGFLNPSFIAWGRDPRLPPGQASAGRRRAPLGHGDR